MNRFAFTLAEVLITLGIIGVVAAMTIPVISQRIYEKQTVTKLVQFQSIMSRALKMAEEEYGEVEGWEISGWSGAFATKAVDNLRPFLKLASDCGTKDTRGNCLHNGMYKLRNGNNYINPALDSHSYKLSLLNGTGFSISTYPDGRTPIVFGVDVNGKNLPNVAGVDFFLFRYENGSVRPSGAPDSTYPYETNCKSKSSTGWGCAFYVVTNKNMNYLH